MLNHIVVMGRLTRDPELRKTASGVSEVYRRLDAQIRAALDAVTLSSLTAADAGDEYVI